MVREEIEMLGKEKEIREERKRFGRMGRWLGKNERG